MSLEIRLPYNTKIYIRIFAKINLQHRYLVECKFLNDNLQTIQQKVYPEARDKYVSPIIFSEDVITRKKNRGFFWYIPFTKPTIRGTQPYIVPLPQLLPLPTSPFDNRLLDKPILLEISIRNLDTGKKEKLRMPKEVEKGLPNRAKRQIASTYYDEKKEPEVYVEVSWWQGIDNDGEARQEAMQDGNKEYIYFAKEREEDKILAIEGVTGVDLKYNTEKQPVNTIIYVSKKNPPAMPMPKYLAGLPVSVREADFVLHAPSYKVIYPITEPNDKGIQGIGVKRGGKKYWLSACHVLMNDAGIQKGYVHERIPTVINFADGTTSIQGNVTGYYGNYGNFFQKIISYLYPDTLFYADCAIIEDANVELEDKPIIDNKRELSNLINEKVKNSINKKEEEIKSDILSAKCKIKNEETGEEIILKRQIKIGDKHSEFSEEGNSGGAVVYDNRLVGMIIAGPEKHTKGASFITPYKYIFDYLELKLNKV